MDFLNAVFNWKTGAVLVVGGLTGGYYAGGELFTQNNKYPTEIAVSKYSDMKKDLVSIDEKLEYLLSDEGMQKYALNSSLQNKKIDSLTSVKRGIVSSNDYIKGIKYEKIAQEKQAEKENNFWLNLGFGLSVASVFFGGINIYANVDMAMTRSRYSR